MADTPETQSRFPVCRLPIQADSCNALGQARSLGMATELLDLISSDPAVLHGQAVIRGTRVPVTVVLDCLAEGMNEEEVREQYPTLPQGVVRAALAYAAALARDEIMPLDPTQG